MSTAYSSATASPPLADTSATGWRAVWPDTERLAWKVIHKFTAARPYLADDFASAGLEAAWKAAVSFRPERAKLSTHVMYRVRRALLTVMRQQAIRRRSVRMVSIIDHGDDDRPGLESIPDRGPGVADAVELADLVASLPGKLAELPDAERVAITGWFLDGRTVKDAAAAVGVDPMTLRRRTGCGLERLRAKYVGRG